MKKTSLRNVSVEYCELEIHFADINLNSIKSKEDFHNAVKSFVADFDQHRETYVSDNSVDEEGQPIDFVLVEDGQIVEPPSEGRIRFFLSTISKHGSYSFEYDTAKELVVRTREFLGYRFVTDITQDGKNVYYDCLDSGMPNEEPFGYLMIDENSQLIENRTDAYFCIMDDEWDDESEERLREITDEWYTEIFN